MMTSELNSNEMRDICAGAVIIIRYMPNPEDDSPTPPWGGPHMFDWTWNFNPYDFSSRGWSNPVARP